MNKEQTNPEITKKIEENTEKLIKEIVADQKKSISEIKKETATKIDKVKAKLVDTAKTRADSDFKKEKAKHELDLKLKITKYRDELVKNFIVKAQEKIATVIGSAQYESSLENLVVEASITLKQPEIVVLYREEDKKILTSQFFDKVSKQLKEHNLDTKLSLAKDHIKSMGGIKLVTADGKISIDNTYEKRIERSLENLKRELSLLLKE
ncbi:MAG: V-type ATP synthase subunit E [Candidatus Heimdallarchaeaceae archaeon]